MKHPTLVRALVTLTALLTPLPSSRAAIESNFDDQVYPGAAGGGWVGGWQQTLGTPVIQSADPLDGSSPYLHYDATGGQYRNLLRQYQSGEGVTVTAPHRIRWKFRLTEADFDTAFTVFNDRVHFFARNAPRLGGSTDASISWSLMAAGAAHTSGAVAGKTFWVFDNVDGTGNFTLENHVDTLVPLVPNHVYSFEVLVKPAELTYLVKVLDETSSVSFQSSAPHRFRNLASPGDSHTNLHFGIQASTTTEPRPFDLDSVSIMPWSVPAFANVSPNAYAIHPAANGIQFNVVALDPIDPGNIGLTLNGTNVSAQLTVTGPETNRTVSFSGLAADTVYDMVLTATNASGTASLTRRFYTATSPFVLYDSEGFTSDDLYPLGPLQAVTHGTASWLPASVPSTVVDVGDGEHGKALERMNTGTSRTDYLQFWPVSSGVITIEFDAWVSTTAARTFDVALMPATGDWASHIAWGAVSGKLAYYSTAAAAWVPVADLPPAWHRCKIINYLSGAAAGRFDLLINNSPVAEKVLWRNAVPGTPLTRISFQSHSSGPVPEYGRIDNLVVKAAPEDPNAFPTPTITNLSPASYAVVPPSRSLQFEVTSVLPISASDISVSVNGSNVSSGLTVTGSPTDLWVSYGPLGAGRHTVEITAVNGAGPTHASLLLYATENPITIFDSGGFTDDLLYPVGYLTAVTNADYYWAPAAEPSEIVDLADGVHGKVLRRMQMGTDYTDYLHFSPVSAGTVIIDLDARVSSMDVRTLDLSLNSASTTGGTQGPFIMWGTNALNYYNRTAWVPVTALDADWHHIQMICYVSGPLAGTFDLKVDAALVGQGLVWRYVVSPVGTLRIGAIRGGVVQYGEVDNLVITAAPEPLVALPVTLLNPVHTGSTFSFSFQSSPGINHVVQHTAALGSANWTTLETIAGDGSLKTVTHTNPPAGGLFYRVKSEVP